MLHLLVAGLAHGHGLLRQVAGQGHQAINAARAEHTPTSPAVVLSTHERQSSQSLSHLFINIVVVNSVEQSKKAVTALLPFCFELYNSIDNSVTNYSD